MSPAWFVPGRLEVLGKHTDYAGGRSLLAAVDRGITATIRDASDGITAVSDASPDAVRVAPGSPSQLPPGHWGHYLQTVVDRLAANFGPLRPAHLSVSSDLPLASGMSSSSALVVATALALAEHNGFTSSPAWQDNIGDRIDLAAYLACVENGMGFKGLAGHRGVGTFGGSEDHTAMLCCAASRLSQVRFCPIVVEDSVELGPEWSFVVAVSGVLAEKTGTAKERYNRASLATQELVRRWNDHAGTSHATLAEAIAQPGAAEGLARLVAGESCLAHRLRAFVRESEELIPAATAALRRGDLAGFGAIAYASHDNASEVLGNQIPETDRLVALARELGALGATGFGAGFGGSVWALVPTPDAGGFAADWLDRYTGEFGTHAGLARTLVTRPGQAAHPL
ncbi:MAG: galactokinase family protein [Propionibacteriaceae bacterium]|nr:galactokinase family protein [Propionibacteriaceae bacterium]